MTPFVYRRQVTIEWGQCDPAGMMFNRRFFEIFDTNSWFMFEAALGVKPQHLASHFGILGIPLVDARANFLKAVKFGDVVEVVSSVAEFRRSSFDVAHRMMLGGKDAAEGRETRVWAARDKTNPEKIGAVPIPDDVVARFGHNRA
ncbi:MAG: acyl-CoA thioesterase [Pseudolabrys sp.]